MAAPGDDTPGSDEPAQIKMDNQHTKLDNAMPAVRTHMTTGAHSRCGRCPVR